MISEEPVTLNLTGSLPWGKLFLTLFFSAENENQRSAPIVYFSGFIVPVVVFATVSFAANYGLLSSEYFFDQITGKAIQRASSIDQREAFERARAATELALKNPATRMVLSADFAFVALRTLFLIAAFCWLLLGFISGRWGGSSIYWLVVSVSLGILTLGVVVHLGLKFLLLSGEAGVGPGLLLEKPDPLNAFHYVLLRCNLFVFWFFWIVSLRTSGFYGERPRWIFLVLCLTWLMVLLASFLVEGRAFLLF